MGDKSEWEKQKVDEELSRLIRLREQKIKVNQKSIEERKKNIKKDFPGVRL